MQLVYTAIFMAIVFGIGALMNKRRKEQGLQDLSLEEATWRIVLNQMTRLFPMLIMTILWSVGAGFILLGPFTMDVFYLYCILLIPAVISMVFQYIDLTKLTAAAGGNFQAAVLQASRSRKYYTMLALQQPEAEERFKRWPGLFKKLVVAMSCFQARKPEKVWPADQ